MYTVSTHSIKKLNSLKKKAGIELAHIQGLTGIGIGLKQVKGMITTEPALIMYVKAKKDVSMLLPEQIIPPRFFSFVTDVQVASPTYANSGRTYPDRGSYRPLEGGISIANNTSGSNAGTLGCIVKRIGDTDPGHSYILSAHHVLFDGKAGSSTKIGQPHAGYCGTSIPKNIIGITLGPGFEGMYPFNDINYYIDCAIARITPGIQYINKVTGLSGNGLLAGAFTGTSVTDGEILSMVGHMTGLQSGPVVRTDCDPILVSPSGREVHTAKQFAFRLTQSTDSGDSGAIVVNHLNQVVGIFHALAEISGQLCAIVCPIAPVLHALQITIPPGIATATTATSGDVLEDVPVDETQTELFHAGLLDKYEKQVASSSEGRQLMKIVRDHWKEVVDLIHHKRPVKVVWHRGHGPAWGTHFINAFRDEQYKFPDKTKGIHKMIFLQQLANSLREYGSDSLRHSIDHYYPVLEDCINSCNDVNGAVAKIADGVQYLQTN